MKKKCNIAFILLTAFLIVSGASGAQRVVLCEEAYSEG
jgi:hypothetical protein